MEYNTITETNELFINTNHDESTVLNLDQNIYIKKRKSPKGFRDKDKENAEDPDNMAVYMKTIYANFLNTGVSVETVKEEKKEEEEDKIYNECIEVKPRKKSKTKVSSSLLKTVKKTKIEDDELDVCLNKNESITQYNLTLSQYKKVAKHYKLKISGNKTELSSRINMYLYFYKYATIIQKHIRGKICRKYIAYHGPAYSYKNRSLCTNDTDFVTMEPLNEIAPQYFFSYKDLDGFIYGFHISSIYNILFDMKKNNRGSTPSSSSRYHTEIKDVKNPYNRRQVPSYVIDSVRSIIRISKMYGEKINLAIEDDNTTQLTTQQSVELRALALFQSIDALGHYSNSRWFLSLSKNRLILMIRELVDIWNYRAQLSNEKKREICYPHGNPFIRMNISYLYETEDMTLLQNHILETLELFVNMGIDNDNKYLGATYVLGAITIVNQEAATAMPWLYQSVAHI